MFPFSDLPMVMPLKQMTPPLNVTVPLRLNGSDVVRFKMGLMIGLSLNLFPPFTSSIFLLADPEKRLEALASQSLTLLLRQYSCLFRWLRVESADATQPGALGELAILSLRLI